MSKKGAEDNGPNDAESDLHSTVSTDDAFHDVRENGGSNALGNEVTSGVTPAPGPTNLEEGNRSDERTLQVGQVLLERFEVRECLGTGGFGAVYAAYDQQLKRTVAIKQSRKLKSFVAGQVREEARAVASLNHPGIVQIHDLVQRSSDEWLIIMECLEGDPLSLTMRQARMGVVDAVQLSLEIVQALIHAHERHLVHSDLKPANVFVCDDGRIKLLDFGLAIVHFPNQDSRRIGGTRGYMSPEQIRGESHLIDGRTDLWAFGVVLYEMLTGVRPFPTLTGKSLRSRSLFAAASPPRQLNPEIDNELQRIILKCLEPLISSRYESAMDLQEDLAHWLEINGGVSPRAIRTRDHVTFPDQRVPGSIRLSNRGLQPFTETDAETYLSLIPGPRDRSGIPDSIRFWKRWVESDDPNTEHPVGVLYGPSGSGKTSYVRAGLFPQLPGDVCRVYVECRPGDLGGRLTRIIESQVHIPSSESSLRDLLHRLRSGESSSLGYRKLLIVLDQFESWALAATLEERLDLAEALRQCDGIQIRALVVTRDDYWMGAKELLHWLEIPMQEGRNVASVELLDCAQAEQILEWIGRESGTLPKDEEPLSKDQRQFIAKSVDELAVDGKVICVHLIMFGKMVKLQHWTPRALRENNGVSGACSLFFHEIFGKSGRTSPEYRRIAPVVPVVLGQLLPLESDTVVEVSKDYQSLFAAAQDRGHAHLIDDCVQLLNGDLRIITVVDAEDSEHVSDREHRREYHYRLSHDFLVEPIKAYLARTQMRDWRSRTMARLVEMSDLWSRRPNAAYLPGFSEFLILATGTFFQPRSETESRFLRAATRLHAGRISIAVLSLIGFVVMSVFAWSQWSNAKVAREGELKADVARLLDCEPEYLADHIQDLEGYGESAVDELNVWRDSKNETVRLRANLFSQHVSGETFAEIGPQIGKAPSEWFDLVLGVARKTPDAVTVLTAIENQTFDSLDDEAADATRRLGDRAAILLAYLGDRLPVEQRMAGSDNLARDQAFLEETIAWRGDPQLWADLTRNDRDANVAYHAGVVLAGYRGETLRDVHLQIDLPALINSEQASAHSIGRFLAKHIGEDVLSFGLSPPDVANWRVGPYGIPMVRFEPKKFVYSPFQNSVTKLVRPDFQYEVKRAFWSASIPVSEQMYRDFSADLASQGSDFDTDRSLDRFNLPEYLVKDLSQPAVAVNLDQAYRFCNWLSGKHGLQECYTLREVGPSDDLMPPIPWSLDEDANGYRLPTNDEYHLTAHGGYAHPDNKHAIAFSKAGGHGTPVPGSVQELFTLIPNRSGIFQMDPNCGTWICNDPMITYFSLDRLGPIKGLHREQMVPVGGIFFVQNADSN